MPPTRTESPRNSGLAIHAERGLPRIDRERLARAWRAARRAHPAAPRRVSVALLTSATMARLHRRFLGEAGPTDVLAFDLRARQGRRRGRRRREARAPFEAEIAIGVEVARREAAARGLPLQREVELYLVHGLLHLAGLDDHRPADRARMRRAESAVLSSVGWPVSKGSG